mmetsp:Transcript_82376/g.233606  ORF Transcript_82376/g.233606 Transcript_82376/m.233606 type:complete len:250 (+) Transcript_82376:65-814(+)
MPSLPRHAWPATLLLGSLADAVDALGVAVHRFKWVESDNRRVRARHPVRRGLAVVLQEQQPLELALGLQDLHHALVYEHVLAPLARARAQGREVLDALLVPSEPRLHGQAGEHLEGPVHAELAVVQVHPVWVYFIGILVQNFTQSPREKHAVWVNLYRPIIALGCAIHDDPRPHCHENVEVQCSLELTAIRALEVAIDDDRSDVGGQLNHLVAVDRVFVAGEEAGVLLVLHPDEAGLVARRQHQGEAEQ